MKLQILPLRPPGTHGRPTFAIPVRTTEITLLHADIPRNAELWLSEHGYTGQDFLVAVVGERGVESGWVVRVDEVRR